MHALWRNCASRSTPSSIKVTVNADNKDLRLNRLRLLNELRVVMLGVADFGKVAGDGGAA